MQEAGFKEMGEYVMKKQNMVAKYISTQILIDICEQMVWMSGMCVDTSQWEPDGLDMSVETVTAAAAEVEDERRELETEIYIAMDQRTKDMG